MARFSDRIDLSDTLKRIPISDLIERAKEHLGAKGYPQRAIWRCNERLNDLKRNSARFKTDRLTSEFIAWHIEEGRQRHRKHPRCSTQRKSLLNMIAAAVGSTPVFTIAKDADNIHSMALRKSLAVFEQHLKDQDKSTETINSYLRVVAGLLLFLEKNGKKDPSKITAGDIQGFVAEQGIKWSSRSMQTVPSPLKAYLKFTGADAEALLSTGFSFPRKNKPVRAMDDGTVEALWGYVEDDDGDMRSKAIVTLLLATGIRPVDIANLTLENICWDSNTMSFVQSKTGVRMNIELFPAMGNAIARYITEQRPKGTGQKFVFLSERFPYHKIAPAACARALKRALGETGIAYVPDGLHCPRALRRSLVSRMIAKDVPIQKAAAAIGHVGERSVDLYTELDAGRMRSICLPVPNSMRGWLVAP